MFKEDLGKFMCNRSLGSKNLQECISSDILNTTGLESTKRIKQLSLSLVKSLSETKLILLSRALLVFLWSQNFVHAVCEFCCTEDQFRQVMVLV